MTPRFKKKSMVILTTVIGLSIFTLAAFAAEFQADLIQKHQGMEIKGKFYIKKNKTRMDMDMMGQKTSMITRMDKNVTWNVQHGAMMYLEMPIPQESAQTLQTDEELKKIAVKKKIGSETVNGYTCDKYEIIYHDKQRGKLIQWFSRKLNFPVKMIYHGPQGDMSIEYKNIQVGNVKDSLFEVPQGFQKMSMPAMGPGMGGMMPKQ
ncbi:MAG: DUF4412 domain-containing protein [Desulfobacterales bacterium]|nr:MAG: DUF4412 domain-containing protein [Desulfobacterales bacterium]